MKSSFFARLKVVPVLAAFFLLAPVSQAEQERPFKPIFFTALPQQYVDDNKTFVALLEVQAMVGTALIMGAPVAIGTGAIVGGPPQAALSLGSLGLAGAAAVGVLTFETAYGLSTALVYVDKVYWNGIVMDNVSRKAIELPIETVSGLKRKLVQFVSGQTGKPTQFVDLQRK